MDFCRQIERPFFVKVMGFCIGFLRCRCCGCGCGCGWAVVLAVVGMGPLLLYGYGLSLLDILQLDFTVKTED